MKYRENSKISHNYANVCTIMLATDTILIRYLSLMIPNARVKFQPNRIRSFRETVEQTNRQTK